MRLEKYKFQFLEPRRLYEDACTRLAQIAHAELFNDSAYQKMREQWCAGVLGMGYEQHVRTCRIAVNDSEHRLDADAFLESSEVIYPFQIAEVMAPGRKRGKEYKGLASGAMRSVPYEPGRGRIEGPKWVSDAISRKAKKKYSGSTELNLLVYANFNAHQLQHEELKTMAQQFEACFYSIWVITDTHIGSLYSKDKLGFVPGWGQIDGID